MAEHYYDKKQTSEFKPKLIKLNVFDQEFEMYTTGGVFSIRKLDLGTKLLLENIDLTNCCDVLDLGCGYGVVGVVLKKMNPNLLIVCSDVNERAVKLTKINAKHNRVKLKVFSSDVFDSTKFNEMKFDLILLNPPQTAGKKMCVKMIEESINYLREGGRLQIVARHQKGGRELSKVMKTVFGNVCDVAKGSGFRVYLSIRKF